MGFTATVPYLREHLDRLVDALREASRSDELPEGIRAQASGEADALDKAVKAGSATSTIKTALQRVADLANTAQLGFQVVKAILTALGVRV